VSNLVLLAVTLFVLDNSRSWYRRISVNLTLYPVTVFCHEEYCFPSVPPNHVLA